MSMTTQNVFSWVRAFRYYESPEASARRPPDPLENTFCSVCVGEAKEP